MRDVAIVSFSQLPNVRCESLLSDVEMSTQVIETALQQVGLGRRDIDFWCSGSTDFLSGLPFSFVHAFDAIGGWPPVMESHVEMDGAWALYEAWVRLQHGDIDTALVYSFGKSSTPEALTNVLTLQHDPYCVVPLGLDSISCAALQACAVLEHLHVSERDLAVVVAAARRAAASNPFAQVTCPLDIVTALSEPYIASPLRRHDCPPISDGAAAVVLAADSKARKVCKRPAWIRGIDHRIEPPSLGARVLWQSPSTTLAAERAGAFDSLGRKAGGFDVAELCAPFSHQEVILKQALRLAGDRVRINPSGGALVAHPLMSAGLVRLGTVAQFIFDGGADRGLAHATSGPCLQQNLVCVLQG